MTHTELDIRITLRAPLGDTEDQQTAGERMAKVISDILEASRDHKGLTDVGYIDTQFPMTGSRLHLHRS